MFTGIIEDIGTIKAVLTSTLVVETRLDGIGIGDSVSVNGICLTATGIKQASRTTIVLFDYSPETRKRTNLGTARAGESVNIERAMKADGRLGGHFLSGHVECQSILKGIRRSEDSYVATFALPASAARYIVPKGSIGVDGISLTVADVRGDTFTVAVIPHTYEHTTLNRRRVGDSVNIEPDMLAKYAERLLSVDAPPSKLSKTFLNEHGF